MLNNVSEERFYNWKVKKFSLHKFGMKALCYNDNRLLLASQTRYLTCTTKGYRFIILLWAKIKIPNYSYVISSIYANTFVELWSCMLLLFSSRTVLVRNNDTITNGRINHSSNCCIDEILSSSSYIWKIIQWWCCLIWLVYFFEKLFSILKLNLKLSS